MPLEQTLSSSLSCHEDGRLRQLLIATRVLRAASHQQCTSVRPCFRSLSCSPDSSAAPEKKYVNEQKGVVIVMSLWMCLGHCGQGMLISRLLLLCVLSTLAIVNAPTSIQSKKHLAFIGHIPRRGKCLLVAATISRSVSHFCCINMRLCTWSGVRLAGHLVRV